MPAMSPTMTEGNIASWKVQEGGSYSAGDVLLEIETDKAQMDVEAQDDGKMAKIVSPDGSKGIKVGTRIAILAEPSDDINALDLSELPAASTSASPPSKNAADSDEQARSSSATEDKSPQGSVPNQTTQKESPEGPRHNTKYPHFPSVIQLLHEHGISQDEHNKIPASGPNGRLLKGDVLAYIGQIETSYAANQSKRIQELGHLDLNDIEVVPAAAEPQPKTDKRSVQQPSVPSCTEVSLPVSLAAVQSVRDRIQRVLGIDMSVETFIARATQVCNEGLPRSKNSTLDTDELFDAVLGLNKATNHASGPILIPQIQSKVFGRSRPTASALSSPDIIDELTSSTRSAAGKMNKATPNAVHGPDFSLFSVSVPSGDERRAQIFLQRLKTALQVEPNKLVL